MSYRKYILQKDNMQASVPQVTVTECAGGYRGLLHKYKPIYIYAILHTALYAILHTALMSYGIIYSI